MQEALSGMASASFPEAGRVAFSGTVLASTPGAGDGVRDKVGVDIMEERSGKWDEYEV